MVIKWEISTLTDIYFRIKLLTKIQIMHQTTYIFLRNSNIIWIAIYFLLKQDFTYFLIKLKSLSKHIFYYEYFRRSDLKRCQKKFLIDAIKNNSKLAYFKEFERVFYDKLYLFPLQYNFIKLFYILQFIWFIKHSLLEILKTKSSSLMCWIVKHNPAKHWQKMIQT